MTSESISLFFFLLVDGIVLGCVYALAGVGLTVVWGFMDLINISHGEFYTLGAYAAWLGVAGLGLHPVLAIVVALLITFLLGMVTERGLIRPTLKWGHSYGVLVTFILAMLLTNLFLAIFGPYYRAPPEVTGSIPLLGFSYPFSRIYAASVSVVAIVAAIFFIKRTMLGKAIQAVSQDKEGSMLMGINLGRTNMIGFGLSVLLAGIAGLVLTPIYGLIPTAGLRLIGKVFAIVSLGGLGSIGGSILAGILLAITENLGATYIAHDYRDVFAFIVIIAVLIIRPKGLFGR